MQETHTRVVLAALVFAVVSLSVYAWNRYNLLSLRVEQLVREIEEVRVSSLDTPPRPSPASEDPSPKEELPSEEEPPSGEKKCDV